MIPKRLVFTWFGGAMPAEEVTWVDGWRKLHPGWEVAVLSDSNYRPIFSGDLFRRTPSNVMRSNIARIDFLLRWGGIYLDTDVAPNERSLDTLIQFEAFIPADHYKGVCQAVLGSEPGHPWMQALVDGLPARFPHPDEPIISPINSYFCAYYKQHRHRVKLLGKETFFPFNHDANPKDRERKYPDSYGIHHWRKAWVAR